MNPNTVFSASLVTSLVLWFPSMQAGLRGDLDLTQAALRYLAALTVSCLAMKFLARLLNAYRTPQQPVAPPVEAPPADISPADPSPASTAPSGLQRRRADRQPDSEADDPTSRAA
jgi:hypothetical protein